MIFKQNQLNDQNFQDVCISIVRAGDLQALKSLLSENGKVHLDSPIGSLGLTFLHLSVIFGKAEIVRWLLGKRAKVDKKESFSGKTPLHLAAYYGRSDVLKDLLDHSKKFSVDEASCLPIHYACMGGHFDIVKKLISEGCFGNSVSQIGSPLDIAIRKQNLQLIDFLSSNIGISCIEPLNLIKDYGKTLMTTECLSPVYLALSMRQKEVATMLLEKFPQFPSREVRALWNTKGINMCFFSVEGRSSFLNTLFSSYEAIRISKQAKEWRELEKLRHPEGSVSGDLFRAILNDRIDDIEEIVSNKGVETLFESSEFFQETPMRLAIEVCYFPLFELLIEKRYFPEVLLVPFFQEWCFMDYIKAAGGFFQLISEKIQLINLKYYVVER